MKAKSAARDFPVVCVGGSAGGLDAYTRLLRHLRADMGVAIVIVNHLRTVATHLHEILTRYTEMPVELITERLLIQPNRSFHFSLSAPSRARREAVMSFGSRGAEVYRDPLLVLFRGGSASM